ncbi:MAG TPA: hypothetical protein DEO57_02130 [Phycisphaerales bacterium]|nr:hypothetical protein [Phycisphaerales bacterium]
MATARGPPMRPMFERVMTTLQLTRISVAFGAVSDLWFMIVLLWMLHEDSFDGVVVEWSGTTGLTWLPLALVAGLVIALGLFAYGASLNDVLDVRRDAAFRLQRPIATGRIAPGQAVVITGCALLTAMVGAMGLGTWSVWMTMLVAVMLLFYNAAGRYLPAVGIVTIGLVHATHMLIPDPGFPVLLPIWLSMTHAMFVALGISLLEDKRPRITRYALVGIVAGWIFWSAVLGWLSWHRIGGLWPDRLPMWSLAWPAAAALGGLLVLRWKQRTARDRRAGAEKLRRYGALWHCMYGSAWFAALGMMLPALCFGVLAIIGFVVMTVLREAVGLTGRPLDFR